MTDFINIASDSNDSVLAAVRDWLTNEATADGALGGSGVAERVTDRVRAATAQPPLTIDLIAHSRSNVLQLGSWDVSDQATATTLASALQHLPFTLEAIRLLGCSTASHNGWSAMGVLHQVFNATANAPVRIDGTTVPIGSGDFSRTRFSKNFLREYLPGASPPAPTLLDVDALRRSWFDRFPRYHLPTLGLVIPRMREETLGQALADFRAVHPRLRWPLHLVSTNQLLSWVRSCVADVAVAPGLLALPDREFFAMVPAGSGGFRYRRMTILLDGAFARIYPLLHPSGVIVRVPQAADAGLLQLIQGSQTIDPGP